MLVEVLGLRHRLIPSLQVVHLERQARGHLALELPVQQQLLRLQALLLILGDQPHHHHLLQGRDVHFLW